MASAFGFQLNLPSTLASTVLALGIAHCPPLLLTTEMHVATYIEIEVNDTAVHCTARTVGRGK
jgi:hypothetical protein